MPTSRHPVQGEDCDPEPWTAPRLLGGNCCCGEQCRSCYKKQPKGVLTGLNAQGIFSGYVWVLTVKQHLLALDHDCFMYLLTVNKTISQKTDTFDETWKILNEKENPTETYEKTWTMEIKDCFATSILRLVAMWTISWYFLVSTLQKKREKIQSKNFV